MLSYFWLSPVIEGLPILAEPRRAALLYEFLDVTHFHICKRKEFFILSRKIPVNVGFVALRHYITITENAQSSALFRSQLSWGKLSTRSSIVDVGSSPPTRLWVSRYCYSFYIPWRNCCLFYCCPPPMDNNQLWTPANSLARFFWTTEKHLTVPYIP